jgi:hypothetical protein
MFNLFARNRKPTAGKRLCRTPPRLEALERRDCPSPLLSNVNARMIGTALVVTGRVQDVNPSNDVVFINGVAAGRAHFLDSAGDFEFIGSGIQAGWIQVTAISGSTPNSSVGSDVASNGRYGGSNIESYYVNADAGAAAPYITISGITYGHQRSITITGKVVAENPAGLMVSIFGVASGSTTTDSAGNFSVTLTASALGDVNAQTADDNGESNVATEALSVPPPEIDCLTCIEQTGNSFVIRGHVNCPDPQGLVVKFGGEVTAVAGQSAIVDPDGYFQIVVTVPPDQNGEVAAQVTDYWGQQSNLATDQLDHSN